VKKKGHHRFLRLNQWKKNLSKTVKIRGEKKKTHHRFLRFTQIKSKEKSVVKKKDAPQITQIKSMEKKSVKICENPW
jgi:hypothetical protein